jgi:hypothetical protein
VASLPELGIQAVTLIDHPGAARTPPVHHSDSVLSSRLSLNRWGNMTDNMGSKANLEEREEQPDYEAPKLDVLGTVEQLTSEFDTTEPPK